ncbi:hypothetical protein EDB19DRAFT_1831558 [Suillus lakei]|nr:hypothetical protein EDB19DRAFT_1831558 [Suillus lakei]
MSELLGTADTITMGKDDGPGPGFIYLHPGMLRPCDNFPIPRGAEELHKPRRIHRCIHLRDILLQHTMKLRIQCYHTWVRRDEAETRNCSELVTLGLREEQVLGLGSPSQAIWWYAGVQRTKTSNEVAARHPPPGLLRSDARRQSPSISRDIYDPSSSLSPPFHSEEACPDVRTVPAQLLPFSPAPGDAPALPAGTSDPYNP